jgi:hypothetical protein
VSAGRIYEAGKYRSRSASAGICPPNQRICSIENNAFHLAFDGVVVDCDRAIGTEDFEFSPLCNGVRGDSAFHSFTQSGKPHMAAQPLVDIFSYMRAFAPLCPYLYASFIGLFVGWDN